MKSYVFASIFLLIACNGELSAQVDTMCQYVNYEIVPSDGAVVSNNKTTVIQQIRESIETLAADGRDCTHLNILELPSIAYEKAKVGGYGRLNGYLQDYVIDDRITIEVTHNYIKTNLKEKPTLENNGDLLYRTEILTISKVTIQFNFETVIMLTCTKSDGFFTTKTVIRH